MGAFEYVALDARGRQKKGVLEGDTARQVRQQLKERQLVPLEISEVSERRAPEAGGKRAFFGRVGLGAGDLALLTRQLATLVRSGLPLEQALGAVADQSEKAKVKRVVIAVRSRVMEGHSLADALAEFPSVFPEIFRATVAAGEQAGHLDPVLERLADFTERRQEIRQKITHALIYPILLTTISIAIVILLLTYVVPKIITVFQDRGGELPALTQGLITLSDFFRDYWLALAALIGAAVFGVRHLLKQPGPKRRFHRWILRVPLVGRIVGGLNSSRFARTLSILAGSGVPVLDAMRIAGEVVQNRPMREAIDAAALRVREGASISRSLATSRLFPPIMIYLIASGETGGELEEMLERAASSQERDLESLINTLLAIFEPVLIVIMGGFVFLIVIAIMLPILGSNQLVG